MTAYDPMYDHSIRQKCTFTKPSSVIKHGLLGDFPAMFDYQRVSHYIPMFVWLPSGKLT
jgi:hypothetical protein